MNNPRIIFSCTVAVLLTLKAAAGTTLWVSPQGRDEADGSAERPFATLGRAQLALQALAKGGLKDEVEVRLRAGTYALGEPLVLTPAETGDGRQAVTFMAHEHERVVLTGSRSLAGTWQRLDSTLWSLEIPAAAQGGWVFRNLFQGGKLLVRAREPNQGFYSVAAVDGERRKLTLKERLPAAWGKLSGVELNTTAWWHYNRQPVAAITEDSVTALRAIGTDASSSRISERSHSRVWLENALEFADAPGEWFLDTAAGRLYLRVAPGEDPNHSAFTAPFLRELVVVRGTAEHPAGNVHFRGIEFAETDWQMPPEGRLGVQAGAWATDRSRTFSPPAALRFIYAANASVESCSFHDLGEGAVAFEIGCHDAKVTRCDFTRVGSNAIQVGRMPEYTGEKHPLHRDFASSREWLDQLEKFPGSDVIWHHAIETTPEAPCRIEIADNTIVDCGQTDYGCVGIWVGYANHVSIEYNLLRNLPYSGINVGWRWAPGLTNCHSNLIRRNRIESIMQQAGDGGGIYLMGEQPGTRVIENYIRDSGRNYWSHGLYTDETSDHMEFAGNYVTDVMDHSFFMNKNGPNQSRHDNNGLEGPTVSTGGNERGGAWVDFQPARQPADPSAYGPRRFAEKP